MLGLLAYINGLMHELMRLAKNTGLFLLACTFAFNAACLAVDGYRRLRKKLHKQQKSRHKDD